MDWANERYVRVYTRDTVSWKLLDWRGRTVLLHLLRKVDRAGVLDVGADGELGLAAILELPIEVVEPGIAQLTRSRGASSPTVVATGTAYVMPHFLAAQETPQTDAQRQRESRAKRRALALASQRVTRGHDTDCQSHDTDCQSHAESHAVTPSLPIRSDPDQIPPPARDPTDTGAAAVQRRRAILAEVWAELGRTRAAVAAELGIEARPLLAMDPGERALAMRLVEAGDLAPSVRESALHAIAAAAAEAIRDRSVQWLTGAIFEERNFRRLAGMSLDEASRPRQRAGPERAPGPEPVRRIKTL